MTYHERKLSERCTYPYCDEPPLDDHCMCERHRDEHRARNRRWRNGTAPASTGR